jgi:hypothetical protein
MQPYPRVNGIQMKIVGLPCGRSLKLRKSHAIKRRNIQKCDSCPDIPFSQTMPGSWVQVGASIFRAGDPIRKHA